jgi:hypothetical protein
MEIIVAIVAFATLTMFSIACLSIVLYKLAKRKRPHTKK